MAHGLENIDWRAPWLAPMADVGLQLASQISAGAACHEALNSQGAPVRFVPQSELPAGEAYEHYIFHSGNCPTRDGLHDFFNGLCWLHFPQTKKRLNQLQAAQIDADGVGQVRGAVRDALTVFDENAAFLHAPQPLWDALVAKDWHTLFVTLRPQWAQTRLLLFGHALMEKLVSPRKPITAHVYRTYSATESIANLDAWVAHDLSAEKLSSKPFAHLPVLGVPGWWSENGDPAFYQDPTVFRASKLSTSRSK